MEQILKLNSRKEKIKRRIGVVLSIVLIFSFFSMIVYWELIGREMALYTEVLVLNQDVQKGEVINASMISTINMENDKLISGAITSSAEIVNKAAKNFIPAKRQIHPKEIEYAELSLQEGEYITAVPREWVYSVPTTIRRKDVAIFKLISPKEQVQLSINTSAEEEALPVLNNFRVLDNKQTIYETTVAYVRDGTNKEVKTVSEEERLDATANVADIEIITTIDDFQRLESFVNRGYKFAIMYREDVMQGE